MLAVGDQTLIRSYVACVLVVVVVVVDKVLVGAALATLAAKRKFYDYAVDVYEASQPLSRSAAHTPGRLAAVALHCLQ